jgi:hypothetical protein
VCSDIDYQRLARYAPTTEDGEAAVAHHAPATGIPRNTHRGELSPGPCCIRPPLLRRLPHLRRRLTNIITIETSRADDAPIRQPSRGMKNPRVEEVRLSRTRTGGQIHTVHRRQ